MSNNKIAWQIFEALQKAGAGIGNASVPIIERVLDEAAQQGVQPTLLAPCPYCKREHDSRVACPDEYAAQSQMRLTRAVGRLSLNKKVRKHEYFISIGRRAR